MPADRLARTRRSVATTVVAVVALCAHEGRPASQVQTPTFRGGASYIRVDMYPTTTAGVVDDLRLDEIELFEDGIRQKIEQLELVRIPPGGPEATRIEPNSIRAGQQA